MTSPAATEAAAPPLLPPGTLSRSQGFFVGWKAEFSQEDPMANSSMLPFPNMTAPCPMSFSTAVALYTGTKFSSIREAQVVATPSVHMTSFICTGTPVNGPPSPAANIWSALAACSSADSGVRAKKDWTWLSTTPIWSRQAWVSSTELSCREDSWAWASWMLSQFNPATLIPPTLR